jgi:hypothetical protein
MARRRNGSPSEWRAGEMNGGPVKYEEIVEHDGTARRVVNDALDPTVSQ